MESIERARRIMGKNFFGIEEAIRYFGVNPARQQMITLSEIPFSGEILQRARNTHVLVAVFPLSILEIRDRVKRELFRSHENSWYNEQAFAKERGKTNWQLVCKTPVDNSTLKNWEKQQTLISEEDEVPTAQVIVYTIISYCLVTGEHLFEHIYVRTSSVYSSGDHVRVGSFDSGGLGVDGYWDDGCSDHLGVSFVRKFSTKSQSSFAGQIKP